MFVSRKINTVAHVLAHRGNVVDMPQTFHLPPPCIVETIINEIPWAYFCQKKKCCKCKA